MRWTVPVVADDEMDSSDGLETIRSKAVVSGRAGARVDDCGKHVLHVDMKGSGILGSCMISSDTRSSRFVFRSAEDCSLVGDDDVGVMIGLRLGAEEDPSKVEGDLASSVLLPVFAMSFPFPFPGRCPILVVTNASEAILSETSPSSSESNPCRCLGNRSCEVFVGNGVLE